MMIDRLEGNSELKTSVRLMLGGRRMTHSVLLVGEEGLGTGFAARCVAADYLYPNGGAPAEALLRGECCRAVAKAGKRDSGQIETGIVREAISVTGMGSGGRYLVGQVTAMRSEIFNTSLSAEGRAVLLYHVERMNACRRRNTNAAVPSVPYRSPYSFCSILSYHARRQNTTFPEKFSLDRHGFFMIHSMQFVLANAPFLLERRFFFAQKLVHSNI